MKPIQKICAIYTRKSTEEGLEQDFNSLDAQREACEAYITSQKADGWQIAKQNYDDGGYSGGNIERPGLKKLLDDIRNKKVHIVVVYKIDRLTRSLMDFSKLVEIFDGHGVTFVSVTQSFNTTTSMGRLTLNVLLSFAQFEREVTSERIRDKIAASKKKGMWMGGLPPLGYRCEDKKLIVHSEESELVKTIFNEYLKSKSVRELKNNLEHSGYRTPLKHSRKGNPYGGAVFSRGHLYKVLGNPAYNGQVHHKGQLYDGLHEAIIDPDVFEQVQTKLKQNTPERNSKTVKSGSLLRGLFYDCDGVNYSPTYSCKAGKRYYYYISQNLLQYKDHPKGIPARLPAFEIEKTVTQSIAEWIKNSDNLKSSFPQSNDNTTAYLQQNPIMIDDAFIKSVLTKVVLSEEKLTLHLDLKKLQQKILDVTKIDLGSPEFSETTIVTLFKVRIGRNGAVMIDAPNNKKDPLDLTAEDLKRIVKGIIWRNQHFAGEMIKYIAKRENHSENYVNKCIQRSFDFLMG